MPEGTFIERDTMTMEKSEGNIIYVSPGGYTMIVKTTTTTVEEGREQSEE